MHLRCFYICSPGSPSQVPSSCPSSDICAPSANPPRPSKNPPLLSPRKSGTHSNSDCSSLFWLPFDRHPYRLYCHRLPLGPSSLLTFVSSLTLVCKPSQHPCSLLPSQALSFSPYPSSLPLFLPPCPLPPSVLPSSQPPPLIPDFLFSSPLLQPPHLRCPLSHLLLLLQLLHHVLLHLLHLLLLAPPSQASCFEPP